MILSLLDAFDDVLVQPFVPDGTVVALDIGVLLGLAGLNVLDGNPMFLSLFHQLFTDVFRAIVNPNGPGFSAPLDDTVKTPDHTLSGQREINLDPKTFAVEVVQHVQ